MEIKLVISLKNGKSYPKTIEGNILMEQKVGSKIDGNMIGFPNSEFLITGGSDSSGFPMRKDIQGTVRKKILSGKCVGIKKIEKDGIKRKTVVGRKINEKTAQVNLQLLKGDIEESLKASVPTKEENSVEEKK